MAALWPNQSTSEGKDSPDLGQALGTNILAGMLDPSNQVWNELVDRALVLHCARDPLGHFDFVCLAAWEHKSRKFVKQRSPQKLDLLPQSTISYLKYRFWLPKFLSMASSEPMPRYFFSLIPSEKKYSPGASVVAARREPIITGTRDHQEQHISSRKAVAAKNLRAQTPPCPQPPAGIRPRVQNQMLYGNPS